jgi:prepilin-type N-terminal cleavage/methylation domain-containing protein
MNFWKSFRPQDGFTITELMVGIAIIGVMGTIAVPNVMKYQARARQIEARVTLAAIYAREKAFAVENLTYSGAIHQLGVTVSPGNFYAAGFNPVAALGNNTCGRAGNASCLAFAWKGSMPDPSTPLATAAHVAFDATRYTSSVSGINQNATRSNLGDNDFPDTNWRDTQVSRSAFRAGATGKISAFFSDFDRWYIDDKQQVTNFDPGI